MMMGVGSLEPYESMERYGEPAVKHGTMFAHCFGTCDHVVLDQHVLVWDEKNAQRGV